MRELALVGRAVRYRGNLRNNPRQLPPRHLINVLDRDTSQAQKWITRNPTTCLLIYDKLINTKRGETCNCESTLNGTNSYFGSWFLASDIMEPGFPFDWTHEFEG